MSPEVDPTLKAIMDFTEAMCDLAVREATGFYTASVLNEQRDNAREAFVKAMTEADTQHEG